MTPCQTVKQSIFEFLSVICHEGLEGHQFCLKILEIIKVYYLNFEEINLKGLLKL
jgi:hypothetical protein